MNNKNERDYAKRARTVAYRVIRELVEEVESQKEAARQIAGLQGHERLSELNEIISGFLSAEKFIRDVPLDNHSSRKEAFVELINAVKDGWLLTARGRGLQYRKSAEMLIEALAVEYEKINSRYGMELVN